jgi:hypothetical protein
MLACPRSSWTYFGWDVSGEEQGGAGVTEVVEPGALRQLGPLEEVPKSARYVAVIQGCADGGGEDETVVPPEGGEAHAHL